MPSFVSQYTNDILRDTLSFHTRPVIIKMPRVVTAVFYFNYKSQPPDGLSDEP